MKAKVGDLVKSLALSDMIMTGNMFAGSIDGPGEVIEKDNKKFYYLDCVISKIVTGGISDKKRLSCLFECFHIFYLMTKLQNHH